MRGKGKAEWQKAAAKVTAATNAALPSDAQVIGAVQRAIGSGVTLINASGGLPGELHKLWQAGAPGSYHGEYGFSTMGYEIAGGLGVKMAKPDQEVVVMLGDGSYLMLNSEIATSVMLGLRLTIVLLDNRGFGCINRLQMATGGANFNNLLEGCPPRGDARGRLRRACEEPRRDRREGRVDRRARSGAEARRRRATARPSWSSTPIRWSRPRPAATGGTSRCRRSASRKEVKAARKAYEEAVKLQRVGRLA